MDGFTTFLLIAVIVAVVVILLQKNAVSGYRNQNLADVSRIQNLETENDRYRWFVDEVSSAVSGERAPRLSLNGIQDLGIENDLEVLTTIDFLYVLNSATRTFDEAQEKAHERGVRYEAKHIREMVKAASEYALSVNHLLGLNASQMLEDLAAIEHRGNISDVRAEVKELNEFLRDVFGRFSHVNAMLREFDVSRDEAGIDPKDPLANFLDLAEKFDSNENSETSEPSSEDESSDDEQ